jgi:hypothetical protein
MSVFTPKISLNPENFAETAILQRPGKTGRRIAALVPELLEMVREENLLDPSFIYQERQVIGISDDEIQLDCRSQLKAPLLIQKLQGAKMLAVGVCTIGSALGQQVGQWFAGKKALQALVLDEIGNAAVSKVASKARNKIRENAATRNLDVSSSLSPGIEGFETDQQKILCRVASAEKLGVTVGGGIMMQPSKSLSFVVGLGEDMPRWTQAEECQYCRARDRCHSRVHSGGEVL